MAEDQNITSRKRNRMPADWRGIQSTAGKSRWSSPAYRLARGGIVPTADVSTKVVAMYQSGSTVKEIAVALGSGRTIISRLLRESGVRMRKPGKRVGVWAGAMDSRWKGDNASYGSFHRRLNTLFGKPKKCAQCGTEDASRSYDWANLTGRYEDPTDFARMCRSCHKKFDHGRKVEFGHPAERLRRRIV